MLAFKYIALHYLKSFLIILISLVLFVVSFDYMNMSEEADLSANLLVIYFVYRTFYSIEILLPIALVFAMIMTKVFLIKSNYLVAFYSTGYTKMDVLKPIITVSLGVVFAHIAFHSFPSFARANEFAKSIKEYSSYQSATRDLFFTYKEKYIYIAKMEPLKKEATDLRIFSMKESSLYEVLVAKKATYIDDSWFIEEADLLTKPQDISFSSPGITTTKNNSLRVLDGFRPKILDQVYEGTVKFTIGEAIESLIILKEEGVDNSNIITALYKIFIYPFFAPLMAVIIFFFVPVSVRFLNVSLFSFGAVLSTLVVWGILYMFIELATNKTVAPEVGIIAPIVILVAVAFRQLKRYG